MLELTVLMMMLFKVTERNRTMKVFHVNLGWKMSTQRFEFNSQISTNFVTIIFENWATDLMDLLTFVPLPPWRSRAALMRLWL